MPFMQQGIWILHTVSSSSEYQLRSACTLMSLFPAAVGQFTVQNDGSGILTVVPIAFFVSEAVRFTSSLLLSFLVGTTYSEADWAALPPRWKRHSLLLKVSMKERLVYQPMEVISILRSYLLLSFVLFLTFLTTHFFQFRFADAEQYWLITFTFFRS